ncbi:MAG: DUF3429 domain-containing protein [Oceanicaulis sp.]
MEKSDPVSEAANKTSGAARVQMISERRETPKLSRMLGYAAMAPLAGAAGLVWLAPESAALIRALAIVWGALILVFLAGVRRGVGFRTEHSPATSQLVIMGWLFALGLAALLAPWPAASLGFLAAGYATLLFADPPAALAGRLPLFMARLRPPQMTIAVIALAVLLGHLAAGAA